MASLDAIFAKEFKTMAQQRQAMSGAFNLYELPLPRDFDGHVDLARRVLIKGIHDEYYEKLNEAECIYWAKPKLKRRRFGSDGKYLKDKDGKFITDEVPLTQGCVAVVSDVKIGVPLKYKPKEAFDYVDCIQKTSPDGSVMRKYVYIIPKDYCYKMNQLALVLSLTRMRSFYYGQEMTLQNGYTVYLFVIPYHYTGVERNYRVLKTKTVSDFSKEVDMIMKFWLDSNILFPVELTQLYESIGDRSNVAYRVLCSNQDSFVRYDKAMSDTGEDEYIDYL